MLRALKVGLAALVVAVFAGVLGTAGAQDPAAPPAPTRTVTANGSGETTISASAGQADRETAYSGALGDAVDAARARAAFLAQKGGVQLGALQSMTEITSAPDRYCGAYAVPEAKGVATPPVARRVTRKRRAATKPAQAEEARCYVPAAVTVTYAVSG
ncbi:MAG: hypothetical protein M3P44_09790 [Actinomycetota bacterium]|nr:hypothetical protein [Actinomycetota bacterium]